MLQTRIGLANPVATPDERNTAWRYRTSGPRFEHSGARWVTGLDLSDAEGEARRTKRAHGVPGAALGTRPLRPELRGIRNETLKSKVVQTPR